MTVKPKFYLEKRAQGRGTKPAEKRVAKKFGGRRISGSGAAPETGWHKVFGKASFVGLKSKNKTLTRDGDVTAPELHIEHKRTKGKSISVSREILRKVENGARRNNADPAVVLTFEGQNAEEDWILLPWKVYNRLLMRDDDEA